MNSCDLTKQESHFAFGKNWESYAANVTDADIKEAEYGLSKLLGGVSLDGQRFLDLGCGSGLHSLAALRLGAKEVVAIDIDQDSVSTTQKMLVRFAPKDANFKVMHLSVFDLNPTTYGRFDTVYSWGVLHHTGDLDLAIRRAASMCALEGLFVFALYRRTWMDWLWCIEKRWYSQTAVSMQTLARDIYLCLFKLRLFLTGHDFSHKISCYQGNRGMDFHHDLHDWMGGWPYESILPFEVDSMMVSMGFTVERLFVRNGKFFGRDLGFFGSGCDEFVFKRIK